tara:strand:+ start:211 stop:546 length:336 start_codon:yes stop_codon:yes gene_type:complete
MKAMLTVKQNGVRVVNPDLEYVKMEEFNRDSIFKILVVECGFQATNRKEVWTHTMDSKFSTQLFSEDNAIFFEYKYKSDSYIYDSKITNKEFISCFLEESRKFFQKMKLSE